MYWRVLGIILILGSWVIAGGSAQADSVNVQRIGATTPEEAAFGVSHLVYPLGKAGLKPYRPSAVILVERSDFANGLIAASLLHHPRNGPLLFSEKEHMTPALKDELLRLSPDGIGSEAQVILVGSEEKLAPSLVREIEALGFTTHRIEGENPIVTAAQVDKFLIYQGYIYHLAFQRPIILVRIDRPVESVIAATWVAHWDASIMYVDANGLPKATAEAIRTRAEPPDVYLLGNEEVISKSVEDEVRVLPVHFVDRISGADPQELAANFAKYGHGDFGWHATSRGAQAFVLARVENESDAIRALPAALLGHLGKHATLLLTKGDSIDETTSAYLESVQPYVLFTPASIPKNHGFVLGDEAVIPLATEEVFNNLLAADSTFFVTSVNVQPKTALVGQPIIISVHVHNVSPIPRTFETELRVNGATIETKSTPIEALGPDQIPKDNNLDFAFTPPAPGTYHLEVVGISTYVTVGGGATRESSVLMIVGALVVWTLLLIAGYLGVYLFRNIRGKGK